MINQFENNLKIKFNELNKKYILRKMQNKNVLEKFKNNFDELNITFNIIDRFENCASYLEFIWSKDLETRKLIKANFCRNRFCPICQKNLAVKNSFAIMSIFKYLQDKFNYRFIFLTLTIPNVLSGNLDNSIKNLNYWLYKYFKRKELKNICRGYIKKIEVTVNKNNGSYHPHIHLVIAVNSSYFTDKNYYLSQEKFKNIWREVTEDSSITQVNVKAIKENQIKNAVLEIAKYMSKDNDYTLSDNVFIEFYNSLKGKKLLSYSGCFKDARKLLKAGKLDEYLEDKNCCEFKYFVSQIWQDEKYILNQLKELSEEELKKYNKQFIEQIKKESD